MKKNLLFLVAVLFSVSSFAQSKKDTLNSKNLIKINLSSLALNNFSFQYERKVASRLSVALGFRYMAENAIPFKSEVKEAIGDADTEKVIDNFSTGNYAITPEIRWYISRKGSPRGFYLAPYARYTNYTAKFDNFDIDNTSKTINLTGDIKTITGGLLLGSQWRLSKLIYLDLWLFGPNFGSAEGAISGKPSSALNTTERNALEDQLNDIEIPLVDKQVTVTANGADVKLSGPWAGVRGLGFNLGFRF